MKALIYVVSGIFLWLGTACSPVIYEAPYGSYPGPGYGRSSSTVIVNGPASYGHHSHRQKHRIEQELARRHHRAAGIYHGEGRSGDLIQITIRGGHLYHQGRRINYHPISLRLAAGDIIRFPSSEPGVDIYILYEHGRLALDTDIFGGFHNTVTQVDFRQKHPKKHNFNINNQYLKGGRGVIEAVSLNQKNPERYERKNNVRKRQATVDPKLKNDKNHGKTRAIIDHKQKNGTAKRDSNRKQAERTQPDRRTDRVANRSDKRPLDKRNALSARNDNGHRPDDRKKKNDDNKPQQDRSSEKIRDTLKDDRGKRSDFKNNSSKKKTAVVREGRIQKIKQTLLQERDLRRESK